MPKKIVKISRSVKAKLYIFCEGAKTEPNYIKNYLEMVHPNSILSSLIVVHPTKKNTPLELVNEAIRHKRDSSRIKGDKHWVVYDREGVAKYKDSIHDEARKKADRNNVNIALSNVCFELWILLHFRSNTATYSSFDNLMNESNLKDELRKIGVYKYEKGQAEIFKTIGGYIKDARARAVKMNDATRASAAIGDNIPHRLNPYTDMPLLLDAIDQHVD